MASVTKNGSGPALMKYRVGQLEDWKPEIEKHLEETDKRLAAHENKHVQFEADMETVQETAKDLGAAMKSINNWLRGIFGSLLVALILMVIDLLSHQSTRNALKVP